MEKMTITEALSEVNLINKKLEHKKTQALGMLVKVDHTPDPYKDEGGSAEFLKREFQSISDLNNRLIAIRSAISKANIDNDITIGETTRSIHDWLTWKREVSQKEINFTKTVVDNVKRTVDEAAKNPRVYEDSEGKRHLITLTAMVDYAAFVKKQEYLTTLYEQLDGKLSLKNATITVSIR